MIKLKIVLSLLLLCGIGLTACGGGPDFEDIEWLLESYGKKGNLQPVLENSDVSATFDSAEGRVTGTAGCNQYFGGYEVEDGSKIEISEIGNTEMWCEGLMDQETAFLAILGDVVNYAVKDGKLSLTSGTSTLVFTRR